MGIFQVSWPPLKWRHGETLSGNHLCHGLKQSWVSSFYFSGLDAWPKTDCTVIPHKIHQQACAVNLNILKPHISEIIIGKVRWNQLHFEHLGTEWSKWGWPFWYLLESSKVCLRLGCLNHFPPLSMCLWGWICFNISLYHLSADANAKLTRHMFLDAYHTYRRKCMFQICIIVSRHKKWAYGHYM